MTRASFASAVVIALLAACSSGSGGTTGGACLAAGANCSSAAATCCAGLECEGGLCLSETGSGNGSGAGTTSGQSATTGATHGGATSGATTTSHGTTGAAGTAVGSGTTSGSATGAAATTSGTVTYCNGVQVEDVDGDTADVATYPVSDEVRLGCVATVGGLLDGGVTALSAAGGILDNNTDSSESGLLTLFPAGCDDLGVAAAPVISTTSYSPPAGASNIETARANQLDGGTVYGIVTWLQAPFYDTAEAKGHSGTIYLQDDSGDPASGIAIYIGASVVTATGIAGYPTAGLARGDVVSITNLLWSPYAGTVGADTQDQLAYTATSVVTQLATEALPAAITVDAADIAQGADQTYVGMRVVLDSAPFSVTETCPAELETN